jgi:hypothetical protein
MEQVTEEIATLSTIRTLKWKLTIHKLPRLSNMREIKTTQKIKLDAVRVKEVTWLVFGTEWDSRSHSHTFLFFAIYSTRLMLSVCTTRKRKLISLDDDNDEDDGTPSNNKKIELTKVNYFPKIKLFLLFTQKLSMSFLYQIFHLVENFLFCYSLNSMLCIRKIQQTLYC